VEGYESHTYGDAFADVYDDWYRDLSDVTALVELISEFSPGRNLCELGVGTGRLAIPLSASGFDVTGVDSSSAMLDRLRSTDADSRISVVSGDMVDDMPAGPFDVVLIGFNTLFNLESHDRQRECLQTCSEALTDGGIVVVEGLAPPSQPDGATVDDVSVKSMTATNVVLSISRHHSADQLVEGQFVEFTEKHGVRLRPWSIRYASTAQLDEMARASGLSVVARFNDANRTEFDPMTGRHLTIYGRPE
jgi:ubiquinone/menaquinone biosynthesis C-methylase UbiE